jgi:DNA-binding PadR family transcriptional regulator
VRIALLTVVAEHPMHGYDLIRELEERSGGRWHPSPGSIYPTLQLLEEQGLLSSTEVDGKRVYSITDEGRAHLEERGAGSGWTAPWDIPAESRERLGKLLGGMSQLGAAVIQLARTGRPDQVERVTEIVAEARKKVYTLLAED